MKIILVISMMCLTGQFCVAQNSKDRRVIPLKDRLQKKIHLQIIGPSLYVEEYNGNDLVVETFAPKTAEINAVAQAAGMKQLTTLQNQQQGPIDKPLPAPTTSENAANFLVNFYIPEHRYIRVRVPRHLALRVSFGVQRENSFAIFKGLSGEVNLDGAASKIELIDLSGSITLSHGLYFHNTSEILLSGLPKAVDSPRKLYYPYMISAEQSDITIKLPKGFKATLHVFTPNGKLFTDLDLVTSGQKKQNKYSDDLLNICTLNGGGVKIYLAAEYGDVYVLKEK